MTLSKKNKSIALFGLFVIFLFVLNVLFSYSSLRIDLTEEKRFTLSPATNQLLENINSPVLIKIYLAGTMPIEFKRLKRAIETQLDEYKNIAGKNIQYVFINPTENQDKKQRFALYKYLYEHGISPLEVKEENIEQSSETMLFPAAIINYNNKEIGVNLLQSDYRYKPESAENINLSIQALEYEFTNAIRKITTDKISKIAFIEGQGELSEPEVISISTTLSEYYQIDRGSLNGQLDKLNEYKALIIASPLYKFSNEDKYVLDQYIMGGGSVLFLLEGVNVRMDSLNTQTTTMAIPASVNLEDMLFRYGLRINTDLVEDLQCTKIGLSTQGYNNKTEVKWFPWYFFPRVVSPNDNPINKYIDLIKTEFISTIDTVNKTPGVKKTVLLSSSPNSRISATPLPVSFVDINIPVDKATFNHKPLPLAVLLEGQFSSLYQNRIAPIEMANYKKKETSKKAKIIVVSDGDIIRNLVSPEGKPYPLGFDRYSQQTFKGNTQFLLNAVNYLTEESDLMSIRNREIKLRPLDKTRIKAERSKWQIINVALPLILLIVAGILFSIIRKRKYTKK
jgi:gliding-associated putative ABC transporter substrate-binding component GldG